MPLQQAFARAPSVEVHTCDASELRVTTHTSTAAVWVGLVTIVMAECTCMYGAFEDTRECVVSSNITCR
eukprot:COSAG05_NODE_962_length_6414_cov_4.358353_3_plen_69_part_00